MTPEQAEQIPGVKEMIDNPPDWLEDWSQQVGAGARAVASVNCLD